MRLWPIGVIMAAGLTRDAVNVSNELEAYVRRLCLASVAQIVRAAYERVAPAKARSQLKATPSVPGPKRRITAADIDADTHANPIGRARHEICSASRRAGAGGPNQVVSASTSP